MAKVTMLQEKKAVVVGHHYYGELYDCDPDILSNETVLKDIVVEAARVGGFNLLDVRTWKINPGVSVIGIVLESHISIHTWPEYRFATVDVYTCGEKGDPYKAFIHIANRLKAQKYIVRYSSRDYRE